MNSFAPAHLGPRYLPHAAPAGMSESQRSVRENVLRADAPGDWESPACLCGATGGRVLTEVDRYGLPYRKVLCVDCGLLRVTPRWTAQRYARFYGENYRDLYSPLAAGAAPEQTLQRIAKGPGAALVGEFVESAWAQHGKPGTDRPVIVEVGAGGGWNLSRLSSRWTRIGYDFDERFLQLGRATFGVDMRRGFMAEALPAVATADCVLLSHVLEHVHDPVATLVQLREAARPDTLILVEVPGIFRLHKTSLDPMRYWQNAHTYTFCARTAVDTCRRAGLEPLAVDEWIRLVLRPSSRYAGKVASDQALAKSIERYLRYCEASHRVAESAARMPVAGDAARRVVRRGSDAMMRAAAALGLVHGMAHTAHGPS